jgi:hypothetical protein
MMALLVESKDVGIGIAFLVEALAGYSFDITIFIAFLGVEKI